MCLHAMTCSRTTVDGDDLRPVYSNTTQLDIELSTRSQREQLSPQFVGRDVINKTRLTWLYAVQLGQLSTVALCRYKHPFSLTSVELWSVCVVCCCCCFTACFVRFC